MEQGLSVDMKEPEMIEKSAQLVMLTVLFERTKELLKSMRFLGWVELMVLSQLSIAMKELGM